MVRVAPPAWLAVVVWCAASQPRAAPERWKARRRKRWKEEGLGGPRGAGGTPARAPPRRSDLDAYCTGRRVHRDVIIYLGQKQHSSYDATHANTLNASMDSLRRNYAAVEGADVIVWHEGDLGPSDANALDGVANVRFCLLTNATGWAVPRRWDPPPQMPWSVGYRLMIRFYAVTVWSTLKRLGYDWVMRMDDDSFILSPVSYDIFERLRRERVLYAYRGLSAECPKHFADFVSAFSREATAGLDDAAYERAAREKGVDAKFLEFCTKFPRHCKSDEKRSAIRDAALSLGLYNAGAGGGGDSATPVVPQAIAHGMPYCPALGQFGYYNNWFVTSLDWWLETAGVAKMVQAFDESGLIFTHRANDLIFQTAAIRLFMPPQRRARLVDFTYQHHTMRHGVVNYGGVESGTRDPRAEATLADYARAYGGKPRPCDVVPRLGAPPERIFIVLPQEAAGAPACQADGTMPFF